MSVRTAVWIEIWSGEILSKSLIGHAVNAYDAGTSRSEAPSQMSLGSRLPVCVGGIHRDAVGCDRFRSAGAAVDRAHRKRSLQRNADVGVRCQPDVRIGETQHAVFAVEQVVEPFGFDIDRLRRDLVIDQSVNYLVIGGRDSSCDPKSGNIPRRTARRSF